MIREIVAGNELLVAPKVPLLPRDIFNDVGPQDHYNSDKDTGELNQFLLFIFFQTLMAFN